jgi:hypothetical protein
LCAPDDGYRERCGESRNTEPCERIADSRIHRSHAADRQLHCQRGIAWSEEIREPQCATPRLPVAATPDGRMTTPMADMRTFAAGFERLVQIDPAGRIAIPGEMTRITEGRASPSANGAH